MIYIKTDNDYYFFKTKEDFNSWLNCQENAPEIIEEGELQSWFDQRYIKSETIKLMVRRNEVLQELTEINNKLKVKTTSKLPLEL